MLVDFDQLEYKSFIFRQEHDMIDNPHIHTVLKNNYMQAFFMHSSAQLCETIQPSYNFMFQD